MKPKLKCKTGGLLEMQEPKKIYLSPRGYDKGGLTDKDKASYLINSKYADGGQAESETKPGSYIEQGGDRSGQRYTITQQGNKIYDSMPAYSPEEQAKGTEVKQNVNYQELLSKVRQTEDTRVAYKPKLKTKTPEVNQPDKTVTAQQEYKQQPESNISDEQFKKVQDYYGSEANKSEVDQQITDAEKEQRKSEHDKMELPLALGKFASFYPPVALATAAVSLGTTVTDIQRHPDQYKDKLKTLGVDLTQIATSYGAGQALKYGSKLLKYGAGKIKSGVKPILRKVADKLTPKHEEVNWQAVKPGSAEDITNKFNMAAEKKYQGGGDVLTGNQVTDAGLKKKQLKLKPNIKKYK